MRVTEVHNKVLALLSRTVTNALDVERFGVAVCNALYHIVDKSSCKTVEGLVLRGTLNDNLRALLLYHDLMIESVCKCALRSLYRNGRAVDFNINARRNSNGLFAYS